MHVVVGEDNLIFETRKPARRMIRYAADCRACAGAKWPGPAPADANLAMWHDRGTMLDVELEFYECL